MFVQKPLPFSILNSSNFVPVFFFLPFGYTFWGGKLKFEKLKFKVGKRSISFVLYSMNRYRPDALGAPADHGQTFFVIFDNSKPLLANLSWAPMQFGYGTARL